MWAVATDSMSSLAKFRRVKEYKASDGGKGRNKSMHGRGGDDVIVKVSRSGGCGCGGHVDGGSQDTWMGNWGPCGCRFSELLEAAG